MKNKNLLHILTLSILVLAQTNFYGQSIVINEIVTDPQQDWSSTSFASPPGGVGSSNDEWIELYIKTAGINLSGWTIELNDSSAVTGDLTDSGAFAVSNYITAGTGTFTNTAAGDYLVLGNVAGSGVMNNSITINLKNSNGTLIDSVTLGGGTGEAPNGNATSIEDEAIFRIPNGTDTDTDTADFSRGKSSIGGENTSEDVLSNESIALNSVRIFKTNLLALKIIGLPQGKTSMVLYNLLGKKIVTTTFIFNENKREVPLPNLTSGIYIAKIQTPKGIINKKIIL
jgi:hypothetical protein